MFLDDKQNYLLNFNDCFFYDKLFPLILAFICGYCFGYFIFELIRKKTQKEEIKYFFVAYNQKYGGKQRGKDFNH